MNKLKRTKSENAITLIALIITIVVLVILAVVVINAVRNDGILQYAKNSTNEYEKGMEKEESVLDSYLAKIDDEINTIPISQALNNVYDENVKVKDEYGNKMVLPAGFKILVDDTTSYAAETINVTKGIVIEDVTAGNIKDETTGKITNPTLGSQFVWIPVGDVYYSATEYKTITLGRYVFADGTTDLDGDGTILETGKIVEKLSTTEKSAKLKTSSTASNYFIEGKIGNLAVDSDGNDTKGYAKDIDAFITSSKNNGGYYLGRYEARDGVATSERTRSASDTNTVVCKSDKIVYNWVKQIQATSLSQGMYTSANFTSDLINSYAWDTAIVFLQEFDDRTDKTIPYSRQSKLTSSFSSKGTTIDKICNIYDMAGNCNELTTETCSRWDQPTCMRGGNFEFRRYYKWTQYFASN